MTTATFEQQVTELLNTEYDVADFRYENGNYRSETTGSDFQLIDRDSYTLFASERAQDHSNPEPSDDTISEWWDAERHIDVDGEIFAVINQRE